MNMLWICEDVVMWSGSREAVEKWWRDWEIDKWRDREVIAM